MRLKRLQDWPKRLYEYLDSVKTEPFDWGNFDCALFVCNCIQSMTGVDPADLFRGRYRTKRGAYRALKRFANGGLKETIVKQLEDNYQCERILPAMAGRGDAVLFAMNGEDIFGVIGLDGRPVFVGADGLIIDPPCVKLHAWRVG
jgi:hypothetical protein